MIFKTLFTCLSIALFCCCIHTTEPHRALLQRHAYIGNSDSITQNLELIALDSNNVQFILRVENKYRDTIDSYMGSAVSADHVHYTHNRKSCVIAFELQSAAHTASIKKCNCPELTVQPTDISMVTDSLEMNIQR